MALLRTIVYGAGWKICDAAGTDRPLYDHLDQGADPPVDKRTFDAIREGTNAARASNWSAGPKWGALVFFLWIVTASAFRLALRFSWFDLFGVALWGAMIALIVWCWQKLILASPANFARLMLAHGHCPSCGYQLSRSPDATTTCPECGSVWKSAAISSSPPPPPSPCTSPAPSQDPPR